VTHEHILPWVRLPGLKDYFGLIALLREFPAVRMTFNLVPSLLVQLEAFAANRARDRYLDVGMKPAAELTPEDAAFIVQNFFHAQRQRMIEAYPRYRELLARRGAAAPSDIYAAAKRFSVDELRDLQVWQKLAWIDPLYLEGDARIRALVAKDRDFSEEDKDLLRGIELELLNAIIPCLPRGLGARPGRAVHLAVLSPDPAAPVRYGDLQAHPPRHTDAAASLCPPGGRAGAARSGRGLSRTAVWRASPGRLAV
jgi:alpha-amylase/alpha-mannosidase (GH57 family)